MAVYIAADHVVWDNQAGIFTNKDAVDRQASAKILSSLSPLAA